MNLQNENIQENSTVDVEISFTSTEGIHKLNNDCLRYIFQYLSIVDRIRLERVCKRWQMISQESWYDFKELDFDNELWGFKKENYVEKISNRIFKKVLNRCGQYLNKIKFSEFNRKLEPNVLNILARLCPNLECIWAHDLIVTPWSIRNLAKNCSKIQHFSVGNSTDKCDKELSMLFKRNPELQAVYLYCNYKVTGKCLSTLNNDSIETIIFDNCPSISLGNFNVVKNFKNLRVLMIDHFHDSNNKTMEHIGSCSDNLESLTLSLCPFYMNSLEKITQLINLQYLDLSCNYSVDDNVLVAIGANCKLLKRVDISYQFLLDCNAVTNRGLSSIIRLPLLKSLLIEDLNNITDQVFSGMPNLTYMNCSHCSNVRDTGIANLIEHSENIEYLNLSKCKNISNKLLEAAIRATKKRKNNTVLKLYLGHTRIQLSKVNDTSPFLQVVPLICVNSV